MTQATRHIFTFNTGIQAHTFSINSTALHNMANSIILTNFKNMSHLRRGSFLHCNIDIVTQTVKLSNC